MGSLSPEGRRLRPASTEEVTSHTLDHEWAVEQRQRLTAPHGFGFLRSTGTAADPAARDCPYSW